MLKKSSILLSSYGSFHNFCCPHQHSINTSAPQRPSASLKPSRRQPQQRRNYADVRPPPSNNNPSHDTLQWPSLPTATTIPTPYQIFQQKKSAPYSKRRFYELVKLYHPDRQHINPSQHADPSSPNFLSHATRLERYRLVVAANTILSDPIRRSAYDRYGAGWNGQPELGTPRHPQHEWSNAAGTGWAGYSGNESPAQNATWEDWERWYQRDNNNNNNNNNNNSKGAPQEPVYFSNSAFVSLIVLVAAIGGMGQVTRVGEYSRTFIEQIESVHNDCSKDLMKRRRESMGFGGNRDERIQSFLKMRGPVGYAAGVGEPNEQESAYRRLLPAPEVCSSGDIKDRRKDDYHRGGS
ncbi:MAG: hypothetical protein M1830_009158 [Pleopsidium flavum]|nr:MAG: hypothetical protein M1830_009158 [Pleopsidium flavum]